jgi:hypothetical protein
MVDFGIHFLTYTLPFCSIGPFVNMKSSESSESSRSRIQRNGSTTELSGTFAVVSSAWEIGRVHVRAALGELDPQEPGRSFCPTTHLQ